MNNSEFNLNFKTTPYDYLNERAGQLCDKWDRTEKIKRVVFAILLVAALTLLVVGFPYLAVPLFAAGFVVIGAVALTAFLLFRHSTKTIKKEGEDLRNEMVDFIENPENKMIEMKDFTDEKNETEFQKKLRITSIRLQRPLERSSAFRCPYIVS